MPTIVCPQCENDSSIQRVSAVVAGGTSTGSFSGPTGAITFSDGKVGSAGGYTHISGGTSTNLAKVLDLPQEPKTQPISIRDIAIFYIVAASISLCLLFLVGISNGTNQAMWATGWIVGISTVAIAIGMIISRRDNNKEIIAIKKPNWDIFKNKWE